ncbi:MAG: hypothetical protein H6806_06425 [Planctomycetes bacterium]|nr:hypothetical protein [Planctomycetota bacterium]
MLARLGLHAHHLVMPHPAGLGTLDLTSPLPSDLEAALASLRVLRPGGVACS